MKAREKFINSLKKQHKVTTQAELKELNVFIPDVLPFVTCLTKRLFDNVLNGMKLVLAQVNRMFDTYEQSHPELTLAVVIGKWTQDYIEGFFGVTRGQRGQHDAVTIVDLFSNLKFQQHTGIVPFFMFVATLSYVWSLLFHMFGLVFVDVCGWLTYSMMTHANIIFLISCDYKQ